MRLIILKQKYHRNEYLIKAASMWVAEQIGLKKRHYRVKANLDENAELKEI